MREAAGLGYLLARSSDTLADTAEVAVDVRLAQLDALALSIAANAPFRTDPILLKECTPAEKILLQSIDDQLLWLTQLDPSSQHLIREVLAVIISGQRLDLVRFGHASDQQHVALHDDATLLDYCHRVAGCVGLFWTRLGHLAEGSDFSEQSVSTMEEWGRQLGCGLQLVNILRDRPEDIANGRFYLPGTNLLHDDEQLRAAAAAFEPTSRALCRLAGNAIPAEFCLVVVRGLAICYPQLFRDPAAPAEDLRRSARLAGTDAASDLWAL
jgi:farnesyl-diphosphate farnesyltransferase